MLMNSKAQGLPVNMIVLIGIALLVLVVVGAFFFSGFGQASQSIQTVDKEESECVSACQSVNMNAWRLHSCDEVPCHLYAGCSSFGPCAANLGDGTACVCDGSGTPSGDGSEDEPTCGDGTCDASEDCSSCEADCGACPSVCSNKICETDESCSTCPGDCGYCPNNPCNGNEVCDFPSETIASCQEECCPTQNPVPDNYGLCSLVSQNQAECEACGCYWCSDLNKLWCRASPEDC